MSAWKSPLLYLGILLIAIAGLAIAVPPFMDWTRYRADIEDYGKRVTGREVTIAGAVEARLFPWPRLRLKDVRIANPPGAATPDLLRTGEVTVGFGLVQLMSGKVAVQSVRVDEPVFSFERLARGKGTWALDPVDELSELIDLEKVSLEALELRNGTVILGDARRGGAARIQELDATVSAPGLDGPWRLRGLASYGGERLSIGMSTGKLRQGQPLRFAVRVAPEDDAGLAYVFDGIAHTDDTITGRLKVRPAKSRDGRSDTELDLRPMAMSADVSATFDTVKLGKIEIAPDDASDAGNLITGAAEIELGSRIKLKTQLKAASIDVDGMTGARGREVLYGGQLATAVSDVLAQMPDGFSAEYELFITSLRFGGETLDGVVTVGSAERDRLVVRQFQASMPGQTTGRLRGMFLPGAGKQQFAGHFDLNSVSLRDFAIWAVPGYRDEIGAVWTGARGRLALKGAFDITGESLRFSAERYTLDDTSGLGELRLARGEKPGVALRLVADSLNVDRYAPRGMTVGAVESGALTGAVDLIAAAMAQGELQLTVQADRLDLHGVSARDIAIDVGADEDGVELRTVEIGEVGGARLDVAGLLGFPDDGVSGALRADIKAPDPRGLLRLFGVIPRNARNEPAWVARLGGLDVRVNGQAETHGGETTGSLRLRGEAGPSHVEADGTFKGEARRWDEGTVELTAELAGGDVRAAASLAGLELFGDGQSAFSVSVKAKGVPGEGLTASATAEALGTAVQYAGKVGAKRDGAAFAEGRLAVLAERAQELYAALGFPAGELGPLAQVLSAEGRLRLDRAGAEYSDINGTLAGTSFSGDAGLVFASGAGPRVELKGQSGRLDLGWLLGTRLFARGTGAGDGLQTGFAPSDNGLFALKAEIAAGRLSVLPQMNVQKAAVTLEDDGEQVSVSFSGQLGGDRAAEGEAVFKRRSHDVQVTGTFSAGLDLKKVLQTSGGGQAVSGQADLSVSFTGAGRSPAGVLSAMAGSGKYSVAGGVLHGAGVAEFVRGLGELEDAGGFDGLVKSQLAAGTLPFGDGGGDVKLDAGIMRFGDFAVASGRTSGKLRAVVDLPSGEIDVSALLQSDAIKDLPPFEIAYAGPHRALSASRDVASMKSFVGVNVLLEGMSKLEALQREEERLFRQEARFEREQVLQQLEDAARARRRAAEEARRKAAAERLAREVAAREAAEAEARRLAEELEKQRRIDEQKRKADELARALAEEEQRRALEEAVSRTRLEKHIRRATSSAGAEPAPVEIVPIPEQKPVETVAGGVSQSSDGLPAGSEPVVLEPLPQIIVPEVSPKPKRSRGLKEIDRR